MTKYNSHNGNLNTSLKHLLRENQPTRYNDITAIIPIKEPPPKEPLPEDPFKVSRKNKGPVPNQFVIKVLIYSSY